MAFSDTVKRVMELADVIQKFWDVELPKRHPTYPIIGPGEEPGPPPPEEDDLRALLESLPPDDLYLLLALDELGWGVATAGDIGALQRHAREQYPDLDIIIDWIAETPVRLSFVPDGLRVLSAAGVDVDHLPVPVA